MQPDWFSLSEVKDGAREPVTGDRFDFIDRSVASLARGDITKREEILWGFTPGECGPYIERCDREVRFHKEVLRFLGIEETERPDLAAPGTKKSKAVGEHCGGAYTEKCKKDFRDMLHRVCATCPN